MAELSPERRAIYEDIKKLREEIGPIDFNVVEALRELRGCPRGADMRTSRALDKPEATRIYREACRVRALESSAWTYSRMGLYSTSRRVAYQAAQARTAAEQGMTLAGRRFFTKLLDLPDGEFADQAACYRREK